MSRHLTCCFACLTLMLIVAPGPADDGEWFDLQRRDLPECGWWESSGGDFADARPAEVGPEGLFRLFPDAIWYTGSVRLVDVEPIPLAIRTYEGRRYTELWLYVDTDADGRLDDETKLPATRLPDWPVDEGMVWWPTFAWPRVTVKLDSAERAGETLTLDLIGYVLGPEYNTIVIMPRLTEEWVASGTFAGEPFEWHFLDYDGDGRITATRYLSGDRLLRQKSEAAGAARVFQADRPREVTTVGGELAKLTIDWPNRRIGLRPYDEPAHTVHLSATDGRGRPMEVVRLTVGARGIEPVTWHRPPDTIRVPTYERRDPFYIVGGLGYHQLYIHSVLAWPDRPEVTWEFVGPAEELYGEPTEIALDPGGPLSVVAEVGPSGAAAEGRLTGRLAVHNARGDRLTDVRGARPPVWRAWFIAPGGSVITHDVQGGGGHWWVVGARAAEPECGTWWLNATCDLGEYQEPVRGSGGGKLEACEAGR